jgi:formylglycine-generating enzyme
MKRFVTSLILLFSLTLTSALRADASSQWMWHGAFPWVYSHAENSWWYMKAGTDGKFLAWKQGDEKWYSFDEVSKAWIVLPGQESEENKTGDTFTIPNLSLEMLWLDRGTFTMGSPTSEVGRRSGETQHEVTLTNGFWLGKHEVTQTQWEQVMGSNLGQESAANKAGDTFTIPDLSLEMLWVEPGTFEMGSPLSETDRDSDENQHQVTLTKGFFLGKFELTQKQYERVVGSNPNAMGFSSVGDSRPVGADDSQVELFMNLLNSREKESGRLPSGWQYALPTEAEWEYACRAGTSTAYSWGGKITSTNANYDNFIGSTTDVGKYPANAWGFHDMHGNVWELVEDGKRQYPNTHVTDPVGPSSQSGRIYRGGSYSRPGSLARSAYRHSDGGWSPGLGVRIALKADEAEVVTGSNPSYFKGANRPVEKVSWNDVTSFCDKLTEQEREAGRLPVGMTYQLPTEAQWEYACRAGTTTVYSWGNSIVGSNANYNQSGISQTRDISQYTANPWGFHDMHGNVFEWTADWYAPSYPTGSVTDPVGPTTGSDRVRRGGSWFGTASAARSAERDWGPPAVSHNHVGFRLSLRPASQ